MKLPLFEYLLKTERKRPYLIAIDGPDGSGKSTFAKHLVNELEAKGYLVFSSSMDYFHNPKKKRYNDKPDHISFVEDSFNTSALKKKLLDPFRTGVGICHLKHYDHLLDKEVESGGIEVCPESILVFEGIFSLQDGLIDYWDFSIFLDTSFEECYRRMAIRDGCPPDPKDPRNSRYYQGQLHYFKKFRPQSRANLVVQDVENLYS